MCWCNCSMSSMCGFEAADARLDGGAAPSQKSRENHGQSSSSRSTWDSLRATTTARDEDAPACDTRAAQRSSPSRGAADPRPQRDEDTSGVGNNERPTPGRNGHGIAASITSNVSP